VRYDRNMEFVVPVAVRRKHVVSLGLPTLEFRFGFERCDLLGLEKRPSLDHAGTLRERAFIIATNGVYEYRNIVADVAMHSNPDDLPIPKDTGLESLDLNITSENRHDNGRSTQWDNV
jgi:hypothetical protein